MQKLSTATGCSLEDFLKAMDSRDEWDARGVTVIVAGNGHGDTSSNPGRNWLHFI